MSIKITASGQACGAAISQVDLSAALTPETVAEIRAAWLEHKVVSFPQQNLSDDDLERFAVSIGPFGEDPYIAAIKGRKHIIALQRKAEEKAPLFAENWHTDWSFQQHPPAATCLYSLTIPPQGGDTLFANQQQALAEMPALLRKKLEDKMAVHSARGGYAPDGMYGDSDRAAGRSMDIRPSADARKTRLHPLIINHPETGVEGIFGCMGYIVGIEGLNEEAARALLRELHEWQTQARFQYRHKWQENMLVMWDNRSVLHRATGGYQGFNRLLHRITIAAR